MENLASDKQPNQIQAKQQRKYQLPKAANEKMQRCWQYIQCICCQTVTDRQQERKTEYRLYFYVLNIYRNITYIYMFLSVLGLSDRRTGPSLLLLLLLLLLCSAYLTSCWSSRICTNGIQIEDVIGSKNHFKGETSAGFSICESDAGNRRNLPL